MIKFIDLLTEGDLDRFFSKKPESDKLPSKSNSDIEKSKYSLKKAKIKLDSDQESELNVIKKRYDSADTDYARKVWADNYNNLIDEFEKKPDIKRNIIGYIKGDKIDYNTVPKSIKDWVKENNNNRQGEFYIIRDSSNIEFDDELNSATVENAQFFELKIDKEQKLMPTPIGKLFSRTGKDGDYPGAGKDVNGKFPFVQSGKILVVSQLWLGKVLKIYIITGKDFLEKLKN